MTDEERRDAYIKQLQSKRFALLLETVRRSKGMSKSQLAEAIGYESASAITAWENGTRDPNTETNRETVKSIANALGVAIPQLKGYGNLRVRDNGQPILTESERLALYLFAPIIKALDDESIRYLIDTGLLLCKASGKEPAWRETEYQRSRKENNDGKQ